MSSTRIHSGDVPADFSPHSLRDARGAGTVESHIDPGEIAVGVIIGRASEYFDFFVYAIASVLDNRSLAQMRDAANDDVAAMLKYHA